MIEEFGFVKVPAELLALNAQTLDSLIIDASAPEWKFEDSSATQVYEGAGEYVLSGKRRSYAEYERALLVLRVEDLEAHNVSNTIKGLEFRIVVP